MAGIDAGTLDRDVTIEYLASEATDDSGFPVETWSTLAVEVPMSKEELRADPRFAEVFQRSAAQLSASWNTTWVLQFREDMDPDDVDVPKTRRLRYRGRVFDIASAVEMGRREGIMLMTLAHSEDPG